MSRRGARRSCRQLRAPPHPCCSPGRRWRAVWRPAAPGCAGCHPQRSGETVSLFSLCTRPLSTHTPPAPPLTLNSFPPPQSAAVLPSVDFQLGAFRYDAAARDRPSFHLLLELTGLYAVRAAPAAPSGAGGWELLPAARDLRRDRLPPPQKPYHSACSKSWRCWALRWSRCGRPVQGAGPSRPGRGALPS